MSTIEVIKSFLLSIHWKDYVLFLGIFLFLYWILADYDLGSGQFQYPLVIVLTLFLISGFANVKYYTHIEGWFALVPFVSWWSSSCIFVFLISTLFDGSIKKIHIQIALSASLLMFCVCLFFSRWY